MPGTAGPRAGSRSSTSRLTGYSAVSAARPTSSPTEGLRPAQPVGVGVIFPLQINRSESTWQLASPYATRAKAGQSATTLEGCQIGRSAGEEAGQAGLQAVRPRV